MSIESLTLLGVIITFLVTIVGWIITYRTQVSILKLQSEHQFNKEQRQVLITDHLDLIKDLGTWFEDGRKIYFDATLISPIDLTTIDISDLSKIDISKIRQLAEKIETAQQLTARLKDFRAKGPRFLELSKIYDFEAVSSTKWEWDSINLPTDLPQIIDAFEWEVIDQVSEILFGENGRAFPKIVDQFYGLHESGIRAIERIKTNLVVPNNHKVKKKK